MVAVEDFLEHHGIRGQKWGVRRKNPSASSGSRMSSDARKVAELRKKPTHALTNKQLQTANTRLNLERNFNSLNPSVIKKGHAKVQAILATVGLGVSMFNLANSPAGKSAIAAGKKLIKSKL